MNFDEYQNDARQFAIYGDDGWVVYPTLGLTSEAGEVAGKVKKWIRDDNDLDLDINELAKELGDVLWYLANLASDLDMSLSDIAEMNIDKLADRKQRNAIKGDGDNR